MGRVLVGVAVGGLPFVFIVCWLHVGRGLRRLHYYLVRLCLVRLWLWGHMVHMVHSWGFLFQLRVPVCRVALVVRVVGQAGRVSLFYYGFRIFSYALRDAFQVFRVCFRWNARVNERVRVVDVVVVVGDEVEREYKDLRAFHAPFSNGRWQTVRWDCLVQVVKDNFRYGLRQMDDQSAIVVFPIANSDSMEAQLLFCYCFFAIRGGFHFFAP